jgi:hypothetical protein
LLEHACLCCLHRQAGLLCHCRCGLLGSPPCYIHGGLVTKSALHPVVLAGALGSSGWLGCTRPRRTAAAADIIAAGVWHLLLLWRPLLLLVVVGRR